MQKCCIVKSLVPNSAVYFTAEINYKWTLHSLKQVRQENSSEYVQWLVLLQTSVSKALGCWLTGLKGHCLLALGRVIVYRGELYTQERLEGRKEVEAGGQGF